MVFDVIIIGGGYAGSKVASALRKKGLSCACITSGGSVNFNDLVNFRRLGGTVISGHTVSKAEFAGRRIMKVYTDKLEDTPLQADQFVLATGKFFSKGLVADMEKIYEPIFGLDVEYDPDRSTWFDKEFGKPQKFLDFGVKTDGFSRPSTGGCTVDNLYACGDIVAGVNFTDGGNADDRTDTVIASILANAGIN